jgi:hypothetical protein
MPRRAQPLPMAVKRLQDRIEQWRRTRERRTAIPPVLWTEAVALAKAEGAYPVARALRINFEGLKRRMAEAAVVTPASNPAFVELPMAPLLEEPPTASAVVEMHDGNGTRVVVRLAKPSPVEVAQVIAALLGPRA